MLPNFYVIGAQKCGTTSLHEYLRCHPSIYLPEGKETKFFVDEERYKKGFSYYLDTHFSSCNGAQAVGEVDPDYIYFETGLSRMAEHLDLRRLKFIAVLRDPVKRAFSHYLMTLRRGVEPLSFEEAIDQEETRIAAGYRERMHYSYVGRGFYYRQIRRFLEYAEPSQFLFLRAEELRHDPQDCLRRVYRHLGVDETLEPANVREEYHSARVPRSLAWLHWVQRESAAKKLIRRAIPWKETRHRLRRMLLEANESAAIRLEMSEASRNRLADTYRDENRMLAELLGWDLKEWTGSKAPAPEPAMEAL
jgi:hypothetical protein